MKMLGLQAGLMSGQSIPMTVTKTATASPLSVIAGLTGIGAGMYNTQAGRDFSGWLGRQFGSADNGGVDYGNLGWSPGTVIDSSDTESDTET